MTNYEKFKDEIIQIISSVEGGLAIVNDKPVCCKELPTCDVCLFAKDRSTFCKSKRIAWLNKEYKELEVDWNKVAVDTLIWVREEEDDDWLKRYFARYKDGKVFAYKDGYTSWTADGVVTWWKYAKLADETSK